MLNCSGYLIWSVTQMHNRNSHCVLEFECLRRFHSLDIVKNRLDKKTTQIRLSISLCLYVSTFPYLPFCIHEFLKCCLSVTQCRNSFNRSDYTIYSAFYILYLSYIHIDRKYPQSSYRGGGRNSPMPIRTAIFTHLDPLDLIDYSIFAWIKV